jgi:saccharopine dehydrogenase (NAD+, L-lysine-forming)
MSKEIRVAIIGCGGVGQCVAQDLARSDLVSELILADIDLRGAESVRKRTGSDKIEIIKTDASNPKEVTKIAKKADLLVNGTAPAFNLRIMEGCLKGGSNYIDMASTYESYDDPSATEVDNHQLNLNDKWEKAGQLALVSMGVEPGASNILARRAADRMESVDYVKVRDGDNGCIEGYEFLTTFSPEAMLEEVLVDPLYWENGRWHRSPALEVSEVYQFPAPVGPLRVFRTEHEESELVPKFLGKPVRKVDFMIGLDEKFIGYVKMLKKLGLTSRDPMNVKGSKVAPFDLVASIMPRPDSLGNKIKGTSIAMVEVGGKMKGENAIMKTWISMSHEKAYAISGQNATPYTTAMPVAVAVEMFARGEIKVKGVKSPEAVDPIKFYEYLPRKQIPVFEEIILSGKSGATLE